MHWLTNIIDWNISRQIVWGIPIPAKICEKCGEGFVDLDDKLSKCAKCGGGLVKDNDTFDTWFSSSQWPFATLGFPDGDDWKTYYPTDVMETGGDLIFFWVARMIMLGLYRTGKVPFKTVYMHGLVQDAKGQKMSKSKGNVINPLDLTAKFGTDAFRMAVVVGNTPGTSLPLSEDKVRGYKNFGNKLWNIARFVLTSADGVTYDPEFKDWSAADAAHMKRLSALVSEITTEMDEYKFYLVAEKLYHYAWHEFADVILEESKSVLAGNDASARTSRQQFLLHAFRTIVKSLHPFIPFVTEEIWQTIKLENGGDATGDDLLMVQSWPK